MDANLSPISFVDEWLQQLVHGAPPLSVESTFNCNSFRLEDATNLPPGPSDHHGGNSGSQQRLCIVASHNSLNYFDPPPGGDLFELGGPTDLPLRRSQSGSTSVNKSKPFLSSTVNQSNPFNLPM